MTDFEKQMMKRAEEILDSYPELKKQSEIREKNIIQFEEFFGEEGGLEKEDIERRPCTQKEKEKLDASIEKMGDLFAGADFFWQMDGALNVSLYHGDYIGIHKDIDISIDENEIDKVEEFLDKKGYGFFLSNWREEDKPRVFERVSAEKIKKNKQHQIIASSINSDGSRVSADSLSNIDMHLIRRNEEGEYVGHEFTKLPKKWFKPKVISFHGRSINCSHPALVAYYKLFMDRAYDENDLKFLAQSGQLTERDVEDIENTFNSHIENLQEIIRGFVNRVFAQIIELENSEEIFNVMINDELVQDMRRDHPELPKWIKDLADKFVNEADKTPEKLAGIIFETSNVSKAMPLKNTKLSVIRKNLKK